ncbi:MAG: EI24 domain-containing protein [Bacteroidota bacterium]|nr:EI24 domain-containing protein [Bacteroidota bacterium]
MLKDIVAAIRSYNEAHRFIRKHKLWKWIIVPGLVYMLMFCISIYFFGKSASYVIEWLTIHTGLRQWIENLQSRIAGFLFTIAAIVLWLMLMLFYFSLFKYLWLILGAPIFAYISEKTEDILEGKTIPFNLSQLLKNAIRGIKIAMRNTLWQSVYLIFFVILSFIPVVGWVVPVFALLIECFYYGFSILDYSLERHLLTAAESIDFIGKRKGLAIANGLLFYLLHLIPVVGWLLAPSYSVVAATLSIHNEKRKQEESRVEY